MVISIFTKGYGPLTKVISTDENGSIIKDGSQCWMSKGTVRSFDIPNLLELKVVLESLQSNQAIALGVVQGASERPIRVAKSGLEALGEVARTKQYVTFKPEPTLMLLDYDPAEDADAKTPDEIRSDLIKLVPEIEACEMLVLGSTSGGVYREGEAAPANYAGGYHLYIVIDDGSQLNALLNLICSKSWLYGYGWIKTSKSGALLERSLFDEAVGSPERLVFEAAPVLGAGLKQLPRTSKHWPGGVLKTGDVRGLTTSEEAEIAELKAKAKAAKKPQADTIRGEHNAKEVARLVHSGMSKSAAREQVERSNNGILTGSHPLQFAGMPIVTVADVLRNPQRYHELACLDPEDVAL